MANKKTEPQAQKNSKKIHRVYVDRDACIGAATCVVVAPNAYEMDSENIAVVLPNAEKLDDSLLLMSAQACPVQAIHLFDEDGKRIFPQ